jgi:hypothetical protein
MTTYLICCIIIIIIIIIIIFHGSAAQRGLWSRSGGFLITHNDAPQLVGILWTSDQPVAETSTFLTPVGIWTQFAKPVAWELYWLRCTGFNIIIIVISVSAAQRGYGLLVSRGFFITHNDAPQ